MYVKPPGEAWVSKSGFRIEADKTPNARGAGDMLGVDSMASILEGIREGVIKGLYIINGDPGLSLSDEEKEAFGSLDFLLVQDIAQSELTDLAHIVLPGALAVEKEGTMTNVNGRIQRIRQAFPQPGGAQADSDIIRQIGLRLGTDPGPASPAEILDEIAGSIEGYAGLSYSIIGEMGAMTGEPQPSEAVGG